MSKSTSDCRATERKHPWPMVRLGDVCEDKIQRIKSISESRIAYIDIASIDNVQKRVVGVKEYDVDDAPGRAQQVVIPGDVLVSNVRPNLNAVAIVDVASAIPLIASTGFCVLRVKDNVLPKYVYYYAQTSDFIDPLAAVSEKASYPSVTDTIVKDSLVPLPPLPVQREIVARLERELAAVEKMKKGFASLAETAKAEFKAELKEVFEEIKHRGTETRRLGDVCDTISTRGHQIKQSEIGDCGKFPVVSQSENDIEGWTNEDIAIDTVPLVLFGDHTCVVKKIDEPFVVGADGAKLLRSSECDNSFLFYFIKETAVSLLDGEYRRHYSDLANAEIPIPPLSVQREVVARLDSAKARAEKLEAKAREGVAVCETMRKAILKEAFE